jgi:putative transcriptional regulator
MLNPMTGAVRLRLSDILKERNLRQIDFAAQTGLSENAISDLTSNGVRQIRLDTIARICDVLAIKPGDLLIYTPETEKSEAT